MADVSNIVAQWSLHYWLVPALAVLVLALWANSRLERRPIMRAAQEMGLQYSRRNDPALLQRFEQILVVNRGHSHRAIDILSGENATGPLTGFRLICEVGSRKSRRLLQYFVVAITTDTTLNMLRLGRRPRDVHRYDATMPCVEVGDAQRSLFVSAAAIDAPQLAVERLQVWLGDQPSDMEWQVTRQCVAGYGLYRPQHQWVEELIRATTALAQEIQSGRTAGRFDLHVQSTADPQAPHSRDSHKQSH